MKGAITAPAMLAHADNHATRFPSSIRHDRNVSERYSTEEKSALAEVAQVSRLTSTPAGLPRSGPRAA